ncbi:hypothetical protein JXD38_04110 [candidate division WOR-3 bacterium]|nr:hypothetical protein [candidate division WOR-3 bacterium]
MPALLTRILRRTDAGPTLDLIPFGPDYDLSGDRVTINSGPLAGSILRIERSVSDTKADFAFFEMFDTAAPMSTPRPPAVEHPVAHCHFDRNPDTGTETLWSIFVRFDYRHRGLSTLLTRFTFRELLAAGRRHWFEIRKLMRVDTEGRSQTQAPGSPKPENPQLPRVSLHNVGLGVVALRLGFRPKPDLERLLASGNVRAVQAIPTDPPHPPGLLLRLESLPGLLVAALVDTETGRPLTDTGEYERFVSPKQLLRQALAGQAVIGNIDYILSRTAVESFAARLADDHSELRRFTAALRRGTQR